MSDGNMISVLYEHACVVVMYSVHVCNEVTYT